MKMYLKDSALKNIILLVLLGTVCPNLASGTSWMTCYSQPNGAVLPVVSDCHVYIYCLDQTPFTIPCPFGMGFSTTKKGCVYLGESDCAADTVTPTSVVHVQQRGTCNNEKREENKQACVGQAFGAMVPYPGDCSKFLVCNCEYPTVKQCQNGTWFDNKLKVCNYPQNVDCEDGNGNAGASTTSSTSSSTKEPTTSTTESNVEWGENCEAPAGMSEDICLKYNNGILLRYPYNCNAYINCTMGCPVMTYCPPDKVFNDFLKICDTPDTAHCTELPLPPATTSSPASSSASTTTEITTPLTTTEITTTSNTAETTIATTESTSTTESNSEWGVNCETPAGMSKDICLKYNNGILLRYPYDCNAYINCTMGCPVMNYCPPDKVFNNLLKICDTPDTAHCTELPMPPITTTEEASTSTTTELTTTELTTTELTTTELTTTELTTTTLAPEQCIPPPVIISDICSSDTQGYYQPYPYNCTAYIKCQGLEPCLKYCENGKIFNSLLGICDEDIECEEIPLPPPTTTTELPITTTTPLPSDVNPNLCRDKEDYTIYPYEKDCSQYLLCLDGEVKVENCPQGWLFNAKLLLCDKATEEVCYTGTVTTTTIEPTTTTQEPTFDLCLNQTAGKTFPYKDNCKLYYYCRGNGEYFIISCPNDNYYDPYSGNCGPNVSPTACTETLTTTPAPTTALTTLSPSQKCANADAGVTYPYEQNCAQYIYCLGNGGYIIMNCPYNNYYYPASGDCGPSDDVDICRKPLTTTPIPTTTEIAVTTPTPTPQPIFDICRNFSQGQLIPYPDNCQKYISCVKPIPIGFYCNNDWYFNESEQKCTPDNEGICTGDLPTNETTTAATPQDICQGLKEGDWQIYPSNCQFYYECLGDGYYMLKICAEGEYFDPLVGQCSSAVGPNYCKQNFETTLPPSSTTPKPKPQGICANQPQGERVPYPKNCTKYIICETPIPVGVNCAQGLEFSTAAQECVEVTESDCGLSTTTTVTPPITKPYNQCTNKPDFTLLPYEENCGMFYICLQDMEHWAYCPQGEYFDLIQLQCIKTDNEDVCRINSTTTTTTTTTTETPTTTTQDPNLGPCYNKPDGTKIPYPDNCTKYIECQYPLNVGYDCPEGLEFSIHYSECVIPELADCSIKTTTIPSTTTTTTITTTTEQSTTPETCANKPTGSTLPYPEDCSKYYMCINGQEILTNCMPNSYYDPATGDCDSNVEPTACQASNTTPNPTTKPTTQPTTPGVCGNEDNGYIYANEENCSQYYMCLNDTSILCQCQNDNYYNPYTKECDSEVSSNECKEPLTTSTTTEISTTPEETSTLPPEHTQDNICCGQKSGTYLPYPNDNTKYVICQYPLPEVYTCDEGSIYDPESLKCKFLTKLSITKPDCNLKNYGETIIYKGDCTKYYFCYGSEAVLLDCSFNWYYDPAIEQCVPRNQYQCPW